MLRRIAGREQIRIFCADSMKRKQTHLRMELTRTGIAALLLFCAGTGTWAAGRAEGGEPAYFVDLNSLPAYAVAGFNETLHSEPLPPSRPHQFFPPSVGFAGRTLRLPDLTRFGGGFLPFFSLERRPDIEASFLMDLVLDPQTIAEIERGPSEGTAAVQPALHLGAIGDNWRVYLNGTLLQQEWHLDEDGQVLLHRGYRDRAIPLDPGLLTPGTNRLVFRVVGNPAYESTGLYQSRPYYFAPLQYTLGRQSELVSIAFIAVYLFIGLYYLFVALLRRRERYNLYFALFSLCLGSYLLTRTSAIYVLVPDQYTVVRLELLFLFSLFPTIGSFFESLNRGYITWLTRGNAIFSGLIALPATLGPITLAMNMLTLWQITALFMGTWYIFYELAWRFFHRGVIQHRIALARERGSSLLKIYWRNLVRTPTGNLLIGGFVLFVTATFDIVDAIALHTDIVLSRYGFVVFTLGAALILANRLNVLQFQLGKANRRLRVQINEATRARTEAEASEKKYRSLFDGSRDAVALLDEALCFVEGNEAARRLFGQLHSGSGSGQEVRSLYEALYADDRAPVLEAEQLQRVSQEMLESREPADLALRIQTSLGEAKKIRARLEPIRGDEVLLHCTADERDPMIARFVAGRHHYQIESTFAAADEICRHATTNLSRYLADDEASFLMVCLREMVINAIEHGSLEITFDEKTQAQEDGRYLEFLRERRSDPRYSDRTVRMEWTISSEQAVYRITDSGPGFDHRAFLARIADDIPSALQHGRGIVMAVNAFDEVGYNERGNQVRLVKRFPQAPGPSPG